jgi:Fic-DOC domain mobile mystery protein B
LANDFGALQTVLDDIKHQIEQKTYSLDEIAARFHHRLVFIHPFPNGNGRHARLLADAFLLSLEQPRFTWGAKNLIHPSQTRFQYIEALRAADKHKYEALLDFAKS